MKENIMKKIIPEFENESEERLFWEREDSSEFVEWEKARPVTLPHLKKSTKAISLRLLADMLERLKVKANAMDVPYQSYTHCIMLCGIGGDNDNSVASLSCFHICRDNVKHNKFTV